MTAEQHDTTAEFNEALAGAFETGNCEGLVPFYTERATLIPPRGSYTVGRPDIGTFWLGVRNRFRSVVFTTTDLKDLGDTIRRETGTYVMQAVDADAPSPEGKYLFVWMLVEGEWQIESSVWNRNAEGAGRRASQAGGQGGGPRGGGPRGGGRRQAGGPGGGYGQGGGGRQGGGRMGGGQGGGYPGQGAGRGGRMGGVAGVGGGRQNQGEGGQGGRREARSLYDQSPGLYSNLDD